MSQELSSLQDAHNGNADTSALDALPDRFVDGPPDGGYGWVCVAACFLINCFTWGVVAVSLSSIPVLFFGSG